MTEEFYHKDIFGNVVDVDLAAVDEEERPLFDKTGQQFNVFTLTDAFGRRDRKNSWIIYQKALSAGLSAEEVFFKIMWQIKSMLLAYKTKDVGETDMKPFPYSKAKSFLKNFKIQEIEKFSEDLVVGYHKARRGEGDIESMVEKVLLSL